MKIGKLRQNVDVSSEYFDLASKDEEAALILRDAGKYRQAMYFILQAMEKYIRAKIFTKVDPQNRVFQDMNRNHSVDDAIELFIDIVSTEPQIKAQVRKQLDQFLLKDINFRALHNNLRYPSFSDRYNSYSSLDVSQPDLELLIQKLNFLKSFLKDVDRLR